MKQQRGFTLVELAIVLVIIGLILGMAFKGKDLIDGAKVKSMQAQYNKVVGGFNIYYEKYGSYPGDGCGATVIPLGTTTTCTGARDGVLTGAGEPGSALNILQNAGILTSSDIQSVFGQPWTLSAGADATPFATATNYLTLTSTTTSAADVRFVCALDRLMDDGVNTTGIVRSNGVSYGTSTDCWAQTGQVAVGIRVLP